MALAAWHGGGRNAPLCAMLTPSTHRGTALTTVERHKKAEARPLVGGPRHRDVVVGGLLRATGGEGVDEADEVVNVQHRRDRAAVAVGIVINLLLVRKRHAT
jgi:hypothetical protein